MSTFHSMNTRLCRYHALPKDFCASLLAENTSSDAPPNDGKTSNGRFDFPNNIEFDIL